MKIPVAVILVVMLMAIGTLPGAPAPDSPRVIEVIADKDNTFKVPGEKKPSITVKPGEKIVVKITSHFGGEKAADRSLQSFVFKKLRAKGWDIRLKEGTQECPLVNPHQTREYLIAITWQCDR